MFEPKAHWTECKVAPNTYLPRGEDQIPEPRWAFLDMITRPNNNSLFFFVLPPVICTATWIVFGTLNPVAQEKKLNEPQWSIIVVSRQSLRVLFLEVISRILTFTSRTSLSDWMRWVVAFEHNEIMIQFVIGVCRMGTACSKKLLFTLWTS